MSANNQYFGPKEWCYTKDALLIGKSEGGISNTVVESWKIHWDKLLKYLEQPVIGSKDGHYLVRCPCKNNHRANANARTANLIVLDGDSRLDPDTGEVLDGAPDPHSVHEILNQMDITHAICSSHSNQYEGKGNRYRVLVPARIPNQKTLVTVISWLIHKLHTEGVMLNSVKENLTFTQGWFTPRCPDQDHMDQYVFLEHNGLQPFPVAEAREWYQQQKKSLAKVEHALKEQPAPLEVNGDSPIARFNKAAGPENIHKLLVLQGYKFCSVTGVEDGRTFRYLRPDSSSLSPGVTLFKDSRGTWRVHSFHGDEDPLSKRSQDAFGLLTLFKYDGDEKLALETAIKTLQGLDEAKHPTMALVDALSEFAVNEVDVQGIGDAEHLYKQIVPKSQLVAIVAPANAGKTAVFEFLAARFPGTVLYINIDISAVHIPAAYERAKVGGYRLICPDIKKGGSIKKVTDILEVAADGGENLSDIVIIIDTLKKIMDLMSKKSVTMVMDLLRRLTTKGASVILLGHTNKYPDQEGWPVYEGVGGLRNDVDALAVMIPFRKSRDIVLTSLYWQQDGWVHGKDRGPVERGSWLIDRDDNRRVDELDDWVDTRTQALEAIGLAVVGNLVADIHDYLTQHPQGVFKTELVDAMVKHPYQHPRRKITSLLEQHTGQFWDEIQQKENNAKLFKPIPDAVLPGTSDAG